MLHEPGDPGRHEWTDERGSGAAVMSVGQLDLAMVVDPVADVVQQRGDDDLVVGAVAVGERRTLQRVGQLGDAFAVRPQARGGEQADDVERGGAFTW